MPPLASPDPAGLPRFCLNGFNGSTYIGQPGDLPAWIDAAAAAGFPLFGPDSFTLAAWLARGETLRTVADKYHVTERDLCDMNHLHAGQARHVHL